MRNAGVKLLLAERNAVYFPPVGFRENLYHVWKSVVFSRSQANGGLLNRPPKKNQRLLIHQRLMFKMSRKRNEAAQGHRLWRLLWPRIPKEAARWRPQRERSKWIDCPEELAWLGRSEPQAGHTYL